MAKTAKTKSASSATRRAGGKKEVTPLRSKSSAEQVKVVKPVKAVKTVKVPKVTKVTKVKKAGESVAPSPEKQEVILQFAVAPGDTGSPEVQVALLTKRIAKLVDHLKTNNHDNHSRRGLLGIVSKRRRLLNYLEKKDAKRYKGIKAKLGLS